MTNREFWMAVYLATIRSGYSHHTATVNADKAIVLLAARGTLEEKG